MKGLGNAKIFATNLRRYLDLSGKLDKDVAAEIGVAPTTFSEWVNGKKYPRIDKIELLAQYFHIQKSDLIEEKASASSSAPCTLEARIVSGGMDKLPQAERERILSVIRAMYSNHPELFDEKGEADE